MKPLPTHRDAVRSRDVGPLLRAADLLDPPSGRWALDPVAWARERCHVHPWARQRDVLESIRDNPFTAVPSCHSTGKSWTVALAAAWWIDVHPAGTALVVTTAPTGAQVKGILWKYINRLHETHKLPGRVNQTEWFIGSQLVALGRKPSDHSPTALSGYHAEKILIVIDEGSGVTPAIFDALSTLGAGGHARTIAIGNPDQPVGAFADACAPGSGWNVIQIGAYDTPAFTGEDVPESVAASLVSPAWVEDRKRVWGEESALYQSKVLGRFPSQGSAFAVVPHDAATACRYIELPMRPDDTTQVGIDIGGGGDRTVLRERRGRKAGRVRAFRCSDPMETVGEMARVIRAWGPSLVTADVIGIGWGVVGALKTELRPDGIRVEGVNFAASPTPGNESKYLNLRAQVWWEVGRELSRTRGWDLSGVLDDVIHELTAPEYKVIDRSGKIQIEPKEDVKKRMGGRSPDEAEALLLAFWDPGVEATLPTGAADLYRTNMLSGR